MKDKQRLYIKNLLSEVHREVRKIKLNELTNDQIKYWALYAGIYDKLDTKNPKKVYKALKKRFEGEKLKALTFFYTQYFKK